MKVTFEQRDEELVLHTEGRIDTYTAEDFEKGLLAGSEKADCVRLDFEKVQYVSSAGLRALLNGQKKVNGEDKEMILCNVNSTVEEVFESTGFIDILTVEQEML